MPRVDSRMQSQAFHHAPHSSSSLKIPFKAFDVRNNTNVQRCLQTTHSCHKVIRRGHQCAHILYHSSFQQHVIDTIYSYTTYVCYFIVYIEYYVVLQYYYYYTYETVSLLLERERERERIFIVVLFSLFL